MFKLTKTACMMSLRRPPEVLLRSAIGRQTCQRIGTSPCLASARTQVHKAAVCTELGKPLQIRTDVPTPQAIEKGQVLIAVHAVGINFADVLLCAGLYQEKPPLPFIPGSEISGEVTAVGEGVTDLAVNDRVLALSFLSGFSEFCVTDRKMVWKMPETLGYPEASALLISYSTAFMALTRTAQVKPGETILVTAAAGALGLAAVDLGVNIFGGRVIAACGGEEKGLLVKEKGAHHVIDYTKEDMRKRVKEITEGKGADVIIDPVGGQVFMDCVRSVAFEGRIVTLGYASGDIPKVPANYLLVKSCSVMGLYWGSYQKQHPEAYEHSIASVLRLSREGKINPHVSKVFPLDQANEALQFLQSRKSTGKVCLQVGKD